MAKFSQLAPLTPVAQKDIAFSLCNFFNPINAGEYGKQLSQRSTPDKITPFSLFQFFTWSKNNGNDLWPYMHHVRYLTRALESKGILTPAGTVGQTPGLSDCYYFMYELSTLAQRGLLWLGQALGIDFIAHEIGQILVMLTGVTPKGDQAVGTGVLIDDETVLTCAHVLTDMTLDKTILVGNHSVKVADFKVDCSTDVGVVILSEKVGTPLPDFAFREALLLEDVLVAGYPTIPRGISPTVTYLKGEISGFMKESMDRQPYVLFNAIARPGNSGGPIVTRDGRAVGIITRSLERQREEVDPMVPLPFFAAVPSSVIQLSVRALTGGKEIPWEDFQ